MSYSVFFFKQKTAYEIKECDWSSDVCSSDLLKKNITQKMDKYELNAVREIPEFIDQLSTWYIRRSRGRFKSDEDLEKVMALRTLRYVLFNLSKMMAPFMPFVAEYIYRELGGAGESVHLQNWPEADEKFIDQKILDYMDSTRKIVELGLAARAEVKIKVRQPLAKAIITGDKLDGDYIRLIKDELNVKQVEFNKGEELKVELDTKITDELKREGLLRELIRTINGLRKKAKLTIQDRIVLEYNSRDKTINEIFGKYGQELRKSILANEIKKSSLELEAIKINSLKIGLKILKV